jgi:RNA polymerase subunit RPABC4/transcription elongation factor Spt4
MPEEEELDEVVDSIANLGDIANLVRCPNCSEMTDAGKNVCESCGFLVRGTESAEDETLDFDDQGFEERLNMTLKPMVPSKPEPRPEREEPPEDLPEIADLEEVIAYASGRSRERKASRRVAVREQARLGGGRNAMVFSSVLLVLAGIATYLLSFLLLDDRVVAGAIMVLGAVLIVIFGNVAVEGAFASRRPVLVAETTSRRTNQYICQNCRTPLGDDELECPTCGSVFES